MQDFGLFRILFRQVSLYQYHLLVDILSWSDFVVFMEFDTSSGYVSKLKIMLIA